MLLSTNGSRGDVEPMVGLAVQVGALGTRCGCATGADDRSADAPAGDQGDAAVGGGPAPRAAELVAAQFGTVAAAAEEWDTPVATAVMPTGRWR
jgi:vancomycin aglycone glucosyltransferase